MILKIKPLSTVQPRDALTCRLLSAERWVEHSRHLCHPPVVKACSCKSRNLYYAQKRHFTACASLKPDPWCSGSAIDVTLYGRVRSAKCACHVVRTTATVTSQRQHHPAMPESSWIHHGFDFKLIFVPGLLESFHCCQIFTTHAHPAFSFMLPCPSLKKLGSVL